MKILTIRVIVGYLLRGPEIRLGPLVDIVAAENPRSDSAERQNRSAALKMVALKNAKLSRSATPANVPRDIDDELSPSLSRLPPVSIGFL